ncbi:hypothetical protein HDV06_001526 [Boothiomyces sp. JEL0866]|nr:hypothetical protein HDV06_001521 [Boothiomyces sp. JEL0866]KAJ3317502.1 hypothetical protein HDV06_001526 [Boothiomyces sp. JEL0866]
MIAILFPVIAAYSLCDKSNYPYAGQTITVQIVPTISAIPLNNQSILTGVSGSITIVDGCDFQLNADFTMNADLSCIWVGGKINGPKDGSDGVTLSKFPVTSSSGGKVFPFISTAGNFVSFKDFNQFRLFNQASLAVIATADITFGSSVRVLGSAPNATTTTVAATQSATVPSVTTSNAHTIHSTLSLVIFVLVFMM